MNDEQDNALCEKFPKIFRDRHNNTSPISYGIGGGSGWYNLIEMGCSLIQHHIKCERYSRAQALQYNRVLRRALAGDKAGLIWFRTYGKNGPNEWTYKNVEEDLEEATFRTVPEKCEQLVAAQVKEKFGTLRFYSDGGDSYIRGVLSMMERMSSITCESCGNPGKTRNGGWLTTLCNSCNDELIAERKKRDEEYDSEL